MRDAILLEVAADSTESAAREADVEPATLVAGRYELIRKLATGGMGVVWAAKDRHWDRTVALKLVQHSPSERRRFRREARAAGRLHSDHVVCVFDVGEHADELCFIVMELLHGSDLGQVLRDAGCISAQRAAAIGIQICKGLAVAHANGVIHRDLKPGNVHVATRWDGTDHVKILDFGVARLTYDPEVSTFRAEDWSERLATWRRSKRVVTVRSTTVSTSTRSARCSIAQ